MLPNRSSQIDNGESTGSKAVFGLQRKPRVTRPYGHLHLKGSLRVLGRSPPLSSPRAHIQKRLHFARASHACQGCSALDMGGGNLVVILRGYDLDHRRSISVTLTPLLAAGELLDPKGFLLIAKLQDLCDDVRPVVGGPETANWKSRRRAPYHC